MRKIDESSVNLAGGGAKGGDCIGDDDERKRLEKTIERIAKEWVKTFDAISDPIVLLDPHGVVRRCNRAFAALVGKPYQEIIARPCGFFGHAKKGEKEEFCLQAMLRGKKSLRTEAEIAGRHFVLTVDPILNQRGCVQDLVLALKDISERKQTEEALRERDQLLQNLSAQIPGMIYTLKRKPDGKYSIPYCSNVIRDIFGVSPRDVIDDASPLFEAILADDRQRMMASIEQSAQTMTTLHCEYRVQLPGQAVRWIWSQSEPFQLPDGSILWYGFNAEITERKQIEKALRESEKEYRTLVTQSPDGIFVSDFQGNFLSVNKAMCTVLNYSEAEFLSLKICDIVPEQYMDLYKKRLAGILKGEAKNEAAEYMAKGKDGKTLWVAVLSAPYYKDNELIGFQGIARDVTEKKKMEDRLRESEEYYRTLVNTSPDAIVIVDSDERIAFASAKAFEIFGMPPHTAMEGLPLAGFIHAREVPMVRARLVEILSGRSLPEVHEYRLQKHDGLPFWGEVTSAPLRDAQGRSIGLLLICRDVSERKWAEEQIKASLREKEVLLQEIHHRVKNNLQIVSGLLTLQADQAGDKNVDEIFRKSQDRIRTIALVHEKLYRSHNLAEIAFDEYLSALTNDLLYSHGVAAGRITVKFEMESISFSIEKAVPLGLIINELVTNALKHAFPGGRKGEIRIGLRGRKTAKFIGAKTESGELHYISQCEVIVADDGVGLPDDFARRENKSMGMNLVEMLAKQLQATLQIKTAPGTEFRFQIPMPAPRK